MSAVFSPRSCWAMSACATAQQQPPLQHARHSTAIRATSTLIPRLVTRLSARHLPVPSTGGICKVCTAKVSVSIFR